jgi:hypothetical protein
MLTVCYGRVSELLQFCYAPGVPHLIQTREYSETLLNDEG